MYNKMRLIRLTSSSNGEFSNNFNEDIVITPNSKIGLKSASISLNETELVLKGNNREVQVKFITGESPTIVRLDEKIYNNDNDNELLTDLELALNSAMGTGVGSTPATNDKRFGIEWNVKQSPSNKTEISYLVNPAQHPLVPAYQDFIVKSADIHTDMANDGQDILGLIWSSMSVPTTLGTSFLCSKRRLAKGRGTFRVKLWHLGDLAEQGGDLTKAGFQIGFTTKKPIDGSTQIETDKDGFALHCPAHNEKYVILDNGNRIEKNQLIRCFNDDDPSGTGSNDIIEIMRSGNKVSFFVCPADTDGSPYNDPKVLLQTITLPKEEENKDLFPCIIFHQGGGSASDEDGSKVILQECRWTLSGYDMTPEEYEAHHSIANFIPVIQPVTATGSVPLHYDQQANFSNNFMIFGSLDVANFLGFTTSRVPSVGSIPYSGGLVSDITRPLYSSEFAYKLKANNDGTYLVLLDSINLNNYDGMQPDGSSTGGRRSILQVLINATGVLTERVVFKAEVPDMMNIYNKDSITLRTLRVRVLDDEFNSIDTFGNDVLVLYVEDGE